MAFLDQYKVDHHDRVMRLTSALDTGRTREEVVRVGSRQFDEYVQRGYRIVNPNNVHHHSAIGLHTIAKMTVPGYAIFNEAVGGHGSSSRNPGTHGSTTWAGVLQMQRHAREVGHPELVRVFAESTANYAHQQADVAERGGNKAGVKAVPSRYVLGTFSVVDKPRVYGYAPEKWIDEDYGEVRKAEDKAHSDKTDKMIANTKKIQAQAVAEVRQLDKDLQAKMKPEMDKLEKAIVKQIAEIEAKGASASPGSPAALEVKQAAKKVHLKLISMEKLSKKLGGAKRGWLSGWRGETVTRKAATK